MVGGQRSVRNSGNQLCLVAREGLTISTNPAGDTEVGGGEAQGDWSTETGLRSYNKQTKN